MRVCCVISHTSMDPDASKYIYMVQPWKRPIRLHFLDSPFLKSTTLHTRSSNLAFLWTIKWHMIHELIALNFNKYFLDTFNFLNPREASPFNSSINSLNGSSHDSNRKVAPVNEVNSPFYYSYLHFVWDQFGTEAF